MSRAFHNGSSVIGSNIVAAANFGFASTLPNFASGISPTTNGNAVCDSSGNIYYIGLASGSFGSQIFKYNIFTQTNTAFTGYSLGSFIFNNSASDGTTLGNITLASNTTQLAIDPSGNIYYCESLGASKIRKISTSGVLSTLVGSNLSTNNGQMCCDSSGNVYINDFYNHYLKKVTPSGTVTNYGGNGFTVPAVTDGSLATSGAIGIYGNFGMDSSNNLYFVDIYTYSIRVINYVTGNVSTLINNSGGAITDGYIGSGAAAYAVGYNLYIDSNNNLYFVDSINSVYYLRQINLSTKYVKTITNTSVRQDGIAATSSLILNPASVALDSSNNFYISESSRIRKVSGGIISTVAGNGIALYSGDSGQATSASILNPANFCIDSSNNLYIAETNSYRVRKVTASTGVISTIAGTGTSSYTGDGSAATSATLSTPSDVAVDSSGNVYIGDASRIRKITASTGNISTIVGGGSIASIGNPYSWNTTGSFGTTTNFTSIAYGNGTFVAVSNGTTVAYSSNGTSWSTTSVSNANWVSVAYGNGVFVAIASGSTSSISSSNGSTWTASTGGLPSAALWTSVAFYNGYFVAVSNGTATAVSTDGTTWVSGGTLPSSANWTSVAGGGNAGFVTVASGTTKTAYSSNGTTWTAGPVLPSASNWSSIAYGNAYFVTVASGSTAAAYTAYPTTSWTSAILPSSSNWSSVTYGNGTFVAVAKGLASTAVSPVGATWVTGNASLPSGSASYNWSSIAYGNINGTQTFVAIAPLSPTFLYSNVMGCPATSSLLSSNIKSLAVDSSGNIYAVDANYRILKYNSSNQTVSLFTSSDISYQDTGDNSYASLASFNYPTSVRCDSSGNVYITTSTRVRKITTSTGIVSTVAGTNSYGSSGDGGLATSASLNGPNCVGFDASTNMYIADKANNKIRQVNSSTGNISTVAGVSSVSFSGIANLQTIGSFTNLVTDLSGNSYIYDTALNNRIKYTTNY